MKETVLKALAVAAGMACVAAALASFSQGMQVMIDSSGITVIRFGA
jgi:hypothetical protein